MPGANESKKTLNKCETRNNKQCSAKQCFANQTNKCLADFPSQSDLFLDYEHG